MNCTLILPSEKAHSEPSDYSFGGLKLKCDVVVVRVESQGRGFGVAFQVKNFAMTRRRA